MTQLPLLGAGFVYQPGLEPLLGAGLDRPSVVEVEPETFLLPAGGATGGYQVGLDVLRFLAETSCQKLVHGVGFPLGGSDGIDRAHLTLFSDTIGALGAPWASEHLSINHVIHGSERSFAGFLLPPLQTPSGVACAASKIRQLREVLPVPFAFETGASYLKPYRWELPDGSFFRLVAEEADCGILLDLHNVWANERNGRQSVRDLLAELPLERVWEVHLAGGRLMDGYWLDAHSGLVPEPLRRLAEAVIPQLPSLRAVVFEIVPDYLPVAGIEIEDIAQELRWMHEVWITRGTNVRAVGARRPLFRPSLLSQATEEVQEWERTLGAMLRGTGRQASAGSLFAGVEEDPGSTVYRTLIRSVRLGTLVTVLRLSTRLIRLWLGEHELERRLDAYLSATGPHLLAFEEALAFGEVARGWDGEVPHLGEILDLELIDGSGTGRDDRGPGSADRDLLVKSLEAGRLPSELKRSRKNTVLT